MMAYIFNSAIMLSDDAYSFGKIYIHQTVYEELSRWRYAGGKLKKFGLELFEGMLRKCEELAVDEKVMADAEKENIFRRAMWVERGLPPAKLSSSASDPDRTYLAIAIKLKANLASEDLTLVSVAQRMIGPTRVFNFADMVLDRYRANKISLAKIREGKKQMDRYREHFRDSESAKVIKELLAK
ncbi:MAG: hypothetical protein J6Y94_03010 [Bacteriovoracaceae bacterium]|nr:hypothetical protein [Bacteriovoracaceae bacterium]